METPPENSAAMGTQVRFKGKAEKATLTDEEIKLRFDYVARDIGKLESAVNALTATIQTAKFQNGRQWPSFITMLLIVVPMYALVIDLIVRGLK